MGASAQPAPPPSPRPRPRVSADPGGKAQPHPRGCQFRTGRPPGWRWRVRGPPWAQEGCSLPFPSGGGYSWGRARWRVCGRGVGSQPRPWGLRADGLNPRSLMPDSAPAPPTPSPVVGSLETSPLLQSHRVGINQCRGVLFNITPTNDPCPCCERFCPQGKSWGRCRKGQMFQAGGEGTGRLRGGARVARVGRAVSSAQRECS